MRRLCLLAAVLLGACASPGVEELPANAPSAGQTPISTQRDLPRANLQIVDGTGRTLLGAEVEIAQSAQARQVGLMHVTDLPENTGMAFVWVAPHQGAFHMLNTPIPLDIAFWDEDMQIVGILQMQPCDTEPPCPTYGPEQDYVGAVELNEGELSAAGVEVGHTVILKR